MPTVKELYEESIYYEHSLRAHTIFYLLREKHIKLTDDVNFIDYSKVNRAVVDEMEKQNYLKFQFIKVYSLKVEDYKWLFVFAKTAEDAKEFVRTEIGQTPMNCNEHELDMDMERGDEENGKRGKIQTFRDMVKEHNAFPALVGYYEKDAVYR